MAQQQWTSLYFRHNFNDTGLYQTPGSLSACPDIIPAGGQPYAEPAQLITDNNWSKDFGNQASANQPNYVYLRGQNLGAEKTSGKLYLYASEASLLLYPTNPVDPSKGWSKNPIKTSNGAEYVSVDPDGKARFVSMDPFQWVPGPIYGDHYCLVSRVVTAEDPNPIPTVGNLNDFGLYISTHPNMGWRNIQLQNPSYAQWVSPAIEYDQGDIGGEVYVFLKCVNAPDGSRVRFSSGTPGPNPPFAIDWMTVKNSPGKDGAPTFIAPLSTVIPANWHSNVVYTWDSQGKTPLPDMKISLEALLPVAPGKTIWDERLEQYAVPLAEIYGFEIPRERWVVHGAWAGPQKAIILGSHEQHGTTTASPRFSSLGRTSRLAGEAPASSIYVIGTTWREKTSSITGTTTSDSDISLARGLEKNVVTETLRISAHQPALDLDADLVVSVELSGPAAGGTTLFSLVTNGVPIGSTVWFKNFDGNVVIETPPTTVTTTNNFQIATLVELPPDYQAGIRVYLQLNGLTLPPAHTIVFAAVVKSSGTTAAAELADGAPDPGHLVGKVTIAG